MSRFSSADTELSRFGDRPDTNRFGDEPAAIEGPVQPSNADLAEDKLRQDPIFLERERRKKAAISRDIAAPIPPDFELQTLGSGLIARAIPDKEFEAGKTDAIIRENSPYERFQAGAQTFAKSVGRGVSKTLGFDELSQKYENEAAGWGVKAAGAAGTAGQVAASLPLAVAGLAGGPGLLATGAVLVAGFGNSLADTDRFQQEHDVEIPWVDRIKTALGHGALDAVLARFGGKLTVKNLSNATVKSIGESMYKREFKEAAIKAGKALAFEVPLKTAEGAALMAGYQTGRNLITRYGYDEEQRLTEGVGEQALLGGLLSGGTAALGVAGGVVRSKTFKTRLEKYKQALIDDSVITPDEAKILGDDVQKLKTVADARRGGKKVEIGQDLTITPDVLSWEMQRALQHNPKVMDLVREQIKTGKIKVEDIFVPPETGPVRPEELAQVQAKLSKLTEEINLDTTREWDELNSVPLTRRALLQGDIDLLQERLQAEAGKPGGRQVLEQAKALIETARRKHIVNDTSPLPPMAGLIGKRAEVLTPIDIIPQDRLKLRVELAKASGYLQSAEKLTDNLPLRRRVEARQTEFLNKIFALRKGTNLPAAEAFKLGKALEAEFVTKVGRILAKDDNSPTGARAQVMRKVAETPAIGQTEAESLSQALDTISKHTANMTQRETVARLLEDLYDLSPEYIKEVATKHPDGRIRTGQSHWDAAHKLLLEDHPKFKGEDIDVELLNDFLSKTTDGFITSTGRFVTREEGLAIAQRGKQLRERDGWTSRKGALSTEDLKLKGDEIAEPKNATRGASEEVLRMVEDLYQKMVGDETYQPWSERVRQGLADVREVNKALTGGVKKLEANQVSRQTIQKLVETLPPEYRAGLLDDAIKATTEAEMKFVLDRIAGTQEKYLRDTQTDKLVQQAKKLDSNSQRTAGIELLKAQLPDSLQTSKSTGKAAVDYRKLREMTKKLNIDQLTSLAKDLGRVVRKGQIERGLYNKWLKYSLSDDAQAAIKSLSGVKERSDLGQKLDTPRHVAGLVFDPASTEAWLYQVAKGDTEHPLYKLFAKDFMEPYSRSATNSAGARKFIKSKAQEIFGFKPDSARGEWSLVKHMTEELPSGIQRGEAMWAYALTTDRGRAEAVKTDGIMARGKKFELDRAISELSDKDKQFVDRTKAFFLNNPYIERAFKNFTLLNGYESERSPGGYFTSRRQLELTRSPADFNDFELHVIQSTDALKARTENAGQPFKLDGGYVSAFYQVADQLSTYAEMGKELHRSGKLMLNQEFRDAFVKRFGEQRFKNLELYWQNKMGVIGQNPSGLDTAMSYLVHARVASKIGFNLWSGMKQVLSVFTALGDDVLTSGSIARAVAEGAAVNSRIGKEMKARSGIASMRLQGGRFAENIMVLGHRKISPRLASLQDKAFILQKFMDERTLRILWRAAELDAKKAGLEGRAAREFVVDKFETALTREQTSDSPIYASELELLAKRSPLLLGSLAFKRDLNRVYNTTRRHVVLARQQPTAKNIGKAAKALFWSAGVNSTGEIGINALRTIAYGLPAYTAGKFLSSQLQNLAGLWYLGGDATKLATGLMDERQRDVSDRDLGLIPGLARELYQGAWATADIVKNQEVPDAELDIKSGVHRGDSKQDQAIGDAIDKSLAVGSSLLGLPFWSLYQQGKGLYNWTRDDLRLMIQLEQDQLQLKKDPEKNEFELKEIERVRERINKIHRYREKGLMEKNEAREEIANILRAR